jgi:hypothetical protein
MVFLHKTLRQVAIALNVHEQFIDVDSIRLRNNFGASGPRLYRKKYASSRGDDGRMCERSC